MIKFLHSKKGYTLVELMIVLVLLSLGAVALMNLFSVGYRAFNRSESRYVKQEAVKDIAERLQKTEKVSAATSADIFDDVSVVPTKDNFDDTYSYLYAKYSDAEDGYYLYHLKRGAAGNKEVCLNPNVPVYVEFKPCRVPADKLNQYPGTSPDDNQDGVVVKICAVDDGFSYKNEAEPNLINKPTDDGGDYIFYELDVTYHFPNMIESNGTVKLNKQSNSNKNSTANKYNLNGTKTSEFATATDVGGTVLRCTADSIVVGDGTDTDVTVTSFCFIATASYGHDSGEVGMLCDFRDKCLLTNPLGTAFVKAYYAISPPIANFIAQNETLKAAVRLSLKPLIIVAEYALNPELRAEGIICLAVGLMSLSGATIVLMKFNKRKRKEKCKK